MGTRYEALEAIARAVEINPRNLVLQQEYARALIQAGQYPELTPTIRQMLTIFPRDPDVLINRGLLASRLGHSNEAMQLVEKALVVDPESIECASLPGRSLRQAPRSSRRRATLGAS